MDILLFGSRPNLASWTERSVYPGIDEGPDARCRRDRFERVVGSEAPGEPETEGPFRRAARAIRRYEVFPPGLVSGVLARPIVEERDTVGFRYHLAPAIDLFFAARVFRCFEEPTDTGFHAGFTYRTLIGHPEYGEETFSVEKDARTGSIQVALRSFSRPGGRLARAFPALVRRFQLHGNRAALGHLERVAHGRAIGRSDAA
jgi:uncharacterized protein (UPF0548 family)